MLKIISNLNSKKRVTFDLGLILAMSILVTLPIFFMGIPGGADMPQHFQFAKTFDDSISEGSFYPSWAADPNNGNGSIGNRFYPPLTHYVFAFFKTLTGNWFDGFCFSIILLFFLGGTGIYFWAREFFDESAALFGAITYILLPYHLNQIYGAAMYAEFAAAGVAPFCFLFAYRVCRNNSFKNILGLGIAYGILILTHLPLTVFCSIALFIYAIFSLKDTKVISSVFRLASSVFVGLLLSSFYWSRMATELNYVNHNSTDFVTDYYSFHNHFLLAKYLAFTGAETTRLSNYLDKTLFISLGILITGAIVYYISNRGKKGFQIKNAAALSAVAVFMATPLSITIWQNFSLLQKTQFPWRWMTLVDISAAIFAAAAFKPVTEYLKTSRRYLALIFIGLWFIPIPFTVTAVMNQVLTYPKDYFNPLIERWKTISSFDCWWTVWAKPTGSKRMLINSAGIAERTLIANRSTEIERWESTVRVFHINEGEAGTFYVETFYYPHWKATVNGQAVEVSPNENGLISLPVPAEKSEVKVYFQEPQFVIAAFYTSGFAWIIILSFLIFGLFRKNAIKAEES